MSVNQEMWSLWKTSVRMSMEMPWVVGQRLWLFSQPWNQKTMTEYELMFTEKAEGFGEMWQVLWHHTAPIQPWMLQSPKTMHQCENMVKQSFQTMNQTLKPLSQRVHANCNRLQK